ncbi:MAG: ferredoxin--NADP reductase [Betaproteobacteria bacterium]
MLLTLPIREVLPATPRARIVRLELAAPFPYEAGQAVLVASHGYPERRPYSLATSSGDARRNGWLELLIGISHAGQPGPHLTLDPGARVDVEGPVGAFVFPAAPAERQFLFVAGGTGVAPLRAMLQEALRLPDAKIGFVYSARTPAEFAYGDELRGLARSGRIALEQTVTRPAGRDWDGLRGRIGRAELAPLVRDPATTRCFICGPPALVDEIPRILESLGVMKERIRIEEW